MFGEAAKGFTMQRLWRLAGWGVAASAALAIAAFTTRTEVGSERALAALGQIGAPEPQYLAEKAEEPGQLAEAVRALNFERERLVARIAVLERNLEDVTGSIASRATEPDLKPEPPVTITEFAVDVGGAANLDALRRIWSTVKTTYAAEFDGLRPTVVAREGNRPSGVDLRLVIGPLENAAAATRICATFAVSGLFCQPTTFDGQRLALR
jgi:hypothetical protein